MASHPKSAKLRANGLLWELGRVLAGKKAEPCSSAVHRLFFMELFREAEKNNRSTLTGVF
ncbi:MAG: hypothetical protein D3917_10985 [Candidatus Electrothrix sp. AX5]|nr:hypothetical protein [Candidatus Electrothrix sp. AX5]